MKNKYEKPNTDVFEFKAVDIITSSDVSTAEPQQQNKNTGSKQEQEEKIEIAKMIK